MKYLFDYSSMLHAYVCSGCFRACVYAPSSDLAMDEAALTGESDAVKKSSEKPIILSGSSVMEGEAVCLVIAVGVKSMRGSIAASLEQEVEVCRRLAPDWSVVAVTVVVCVVVAVLFFSACEHSSLHPDIVLLFLIVPCCC